MTQATEDSPATPLSAARISLVLLLSINLFNYVDRYVLAAVEPKIQAALFPDLSANDPHALSMMGLLGTAFIVSYMVAAPLLGWLADRYSRWMLCGISVLIWSLATGGSGLAPTFAAMLAMRLFVGIGEAGYGPAAPTIISDLYPIKRRGSVLAWFYMAIPVGSALGYGLGGVIGSAFGWRRAFFAVTPPGLLLGILCFFMRDPPRGAVDTSHVSSRRAHLQDYLALLRNRSYLLDTAGMTAMTFAMGGISYWMPRYVASERHAADLGTANLIFGAITVVAGIAATLLGGIAGDKLRPRFPGSYFLVSAIGILISCPFILLMLYVPFPAAWVMIFLAEFWLFFNTGPSNTILANVTHPTVRASAFAVNIFLIHLLGDAISAPILGNIAGHFGWSAAFGVVTATTAVAGILWLIGVPHLAPDTEAALDFPDKFT
ncbi:MAG: MFS transporter [Tepidisphaeraceae bacterium]|jgi:MFS family permease